MICKREFQEVVLAMQDNPSEETKRRYNELIVNIANAVAKRYAAKNPVLEVDDAVQDILLAFLSREIYKRITPGKNAFGYFYMAGMNTMHNIYNKSIKEPSNYCDNTPEYRENFKDDFEEEDMFRFLEWDIETVTVDKAKPGKRPSKVEAPIALHWVYMFKTLKKNKTMYESALIKMIPQDKLAKMKDPGKNIEYFMRRLAKKEKLTIVVNKGKDVRYTVMGAK